MAYSKQNFQNGQILNAANLEKMENGIIAGQGAHNLLDNSDFRNPVNQSGKTSYTGAGYTIDRWKAGVSDCSMYVNAGQSVAFNTKTEGVNAYWRQYLPHSLSQLEGKTFTLAIKDAWGKTHCASGVYPTSAPSDTKSVIWINMYENVSIVLYCTIDGTAFVQLTTKKSVPIVWVALYEGSYTTDTLPSYVPKGKHVEMLNCNVPLAPYNLLDNSDFRNPVNQRGIASGAVITGWDYFIDRWRARAENCSVNFSGEGITASTPIGQFLPKETVKNGMTVTAAAKWSDGTICVASGAIRRTNEWGSFSSANINGHSLYVSDEGDGNHACITISEGTVVWAALYEGSYDASTLPVYQPKGYAAELAECQRYFIRVSNSAAYGIISGTGCVVKVPLPMTMRKDIVPTATFDSAAWAYTHEGYVGLTFIGTTYSTNTASLHFTLGTETSARCCVVPDLSFNISADL